MELIVFLITALAFGLAARAAGLPPLGGYLLAGFVLHAFGFESTGALEDVADIGVLLLLFGIGLKLPLRTLARAEVWATAGVVTALSTGAFAAILLGLGAFGVPLAADLDLGAAVIVGFALSFSSTVFAVKALEEANEAASLGGRLAVAVLIIQDVLAVAFLVAIGGTWPSIWALLVLPGLIALRPLFGWLLDRSDHGEMLVLLGFAAALGAGAGLFDLVGLKPDLGALVVGLVLSRHQRSGELANRLLGFKDLFLVGFFLSIGLGGTPPAAGWVIGVLLLVIVPAKTAAFGWMFTRFRLRARTAMHASLTLSTYSEFGLIVGAAALASGRLDQSWVSTVAVAVAASFVLSSAANTARYRLYERWSAGLVRFEKHPPIEEDAVIDCGDARVLIFGMGRVGTGAYDELTLRRGPIVVGVDRRDETVAMHRLQKRRVVRGDALDRDFWDKVRFHPDVELVIAAMSSHTANIECAKRVQEFLPSAHIAAIALYPDHVEELREAGVTVARNLYEEAGQALADDAVSVVFERGD